MIRFKRLSLRRLLFFGSAFVLFWIFIFSLSPITSPLPPYTGPHEVGILDLEVEVEKKVINNAILKETGQPAFELSTIAITLYYPSTPIRPSPSKSQPLARPWLPQPISLIGTGYARLAHVYFPPFQALFTFTMWLLGSKTVVPGTVDAPLLSKPGEVLVDESGVVAGLGKVVGNKGELRKEDEEGDDDEGKFPLVVFTHGMAGMSQSYSHYLGSIASHGVVVAAIEHRDGSGPGSIIHFKGEKERTVWHVQVEDLEHDPPMTASDLKVAQLAFRETEAIETIRLFRMLNAGHGDLIQNLKPNSPRTVLPAFKNRLNMSAITIAGHSYGATGALQALKNAPSEELPLNGAIALDPGKGSGKLNEEIEVPVLVMNSGQWTEKQTEFYGLGWHFDVVKKIVEDAKKGWFMTLTGSAHPSCTDAPLIVPWIMKLVTGTTLDPRVALKEYADVSVEFLEYLRDGKRRRVLKSEVTSPDGSLGDREKRKKVRGKEGAEWEVHVAPER
ncbi:hypothetical protein K469DRAFT_713302 [Zopfia rhizophila CBS 207.26]|uniref:Putative phospholipase n=1 Tax=Zopfia rhizophila CBS 207.26 TaxID=1314779 RepID=A0A6A6DU03_9PEZI|nr:hypothetical protein K469DRAFT_713302 [Zopfia rhizophila CBS 207.26]